MATNRELLIEFIGYVEEALKAARDTRTDFAPKELHEPILTAWPDIATAIGEVRSTLKEGGTDLDARLAEAGLAGPALELKITAVKRARTSWLERKVGKLLLSFLRWINIPLGSLASVIPGAEILKQYKEILERALAESEP